MDKDKGNSNIQTGKGTNIPEPHKEVIDQQHILNALNDMVVYHDLNMNVLWTNQSAADAVNKTTQQIIGRPCYVSFGTRPDTTCTDCPVKNSLARKEITSIRKKRPDGKTWEIKAFPVYTKESGIVGVLETMTDISKLTDVENALKDANKRYEAILSAVPDLLFVINKKGIFVDYHASRLETLFIPPVMFLNKNMKEVLPEVLWRLCKDALDYTLSTGKNKSFSYHLDMDQKRHYFEATMVKTKEDIGICIIKDTTLQKQTEISLHEKIIELEKFNQIMIGRENKMIELKKEINELHKRLNLPSRYKSPLKSEAE